MEQGWESSMCSRGHTQPVRLVSGPALYSDRLASELQTFQILVLVSAVSRHTVTKSKMRAVKEKSRALMAPSTAVRACTPSRWCN